MSTFDAELSRLNPNTVCLATIDGDVTVSELRQRSAKRREQMRALSGHRVAVCDFSPGALIEVIIALDGYVSGIFLLPSGMDDGERKKLISDAYCEFVLNESNGIAAINSESIITGSTDRPTRWILATSGTTGLPKIIMHTLQSLTSTMKRDASRGAAFRWGLMYDPCRFAGLQVVLQAIIGGSCLALPGQMTFEDQVVALLDNKVNALSATPSLWRKLLMDGRILNLAMSQITLGGETVDQTLLNLLQKNFPGARIVHIYASTDAGVAFAVKDGCAGFPASWIDSDKAPLPIRIGMNGQLLIKPSELPTGDGLVGRLDKDGFLDTQDLVRLEGVRVYFLGRASGAINVGGNKVHPEEIESVIREVADVQDVHVFPKSSSMMGQLVAAEAVAVIGADEKKLRQQIFQHCRERLAPWQCPALIGIVKQLHETEAGKRRR